MLPEQVSENWDKFAPALERSLPPIVYDRRLRMSNVLFSVLKEELEVWVYYDEKNRERYVVSTYIRTDPISFSKDFLIYSFTSLGEMVPKHFEQGLAVLSKYARSNDCECITAFVQDKRIAKFLKTQGADISFNLAQLEV